MLITGRHFVIGVCLVCCAASAANAAPIGYAFSGTLSQPYDGSTQFSGTFYYDTSLLPFQMTTPPPTLGSIEYVGAPFGNGVVALSFNLPGNLTTSVLSPNGDLTYPSVVVTHTQSSDSIDISQSFDSAPGQGLTAYVSLQNNNLVQAAPFSSTNLPTGLSLANFSLGGNFLLEGTIGNGPNLNIFGTITSLTPLSASSDAPVPEPSTVLVFLVMGAGLAVRLRKNGERRNA
jgi:PEP-CTERM motif